MFSYEGVREPLQSSAIRTLPTAAELGGDFSQLFNSKGQQILIYDPTSKIQQPDGSYLRAPFTGNRIPMDKINPIAAKLTSYYPKPNVSGVGLDNVNNYSALNPQTKSYTAVLGKMDIRVSQKSNVSFRYGHTPSLSSPSLIWGNNVAEPSTGQTRSPRN